MNGSPQLRRALLLHEQGRHEQAEKELRHHLAVEPGDGFAHALLALSLLEQEQFDAAEAAGREAMGHAPDLGFVHYALARILSRRQRDAEAINAILEAIRIEPTDADYHGLLAGIEFDRRRWTEALRAAEAGLQFDSEHVGCNNLRAMALVKLGRREEAGATIESTLARNPEDAFSQANQAWTLLESGRRREAMEHFRESLRLDPTNEWARAGLVEALKAGNPVYSVMLKYFLWMQKLPDGARWGILIGGYFGNRLLGGVAASNPAWAPWIMPLRVLYVAFALLTWLASPLFNLALFLHPTGRYALNDDQRAQATWVGACLGLALASVAAWLLAPGTGPWLMPAIVFGLLALPASAVHGCDPGWPRTTMAGITFALLALGVTAVVGMWFRTPGEPSTGGLGLAAFGFFLIGTFASQWIANWLATQRPQR